MTSRKEARRQARPLRKEYPKLTINVKEVSPKNWGVRFSPKGKRDRFRY